MNHIIAWLAGAVVGVGALLSAVAGAPASAPDAGTNLRMTNEVRVYQMVKDAVVNITSTKLVNARVGTGDPFFDQMFGPSIIRTVPAESLGSGFIIHPAGYIVTNEHVIDRASDVQVVLSDGQKLQAQVIATDNEHDLAVLKVTPAKDKPLPAITLGATEDLMVGEPVYAIGNPLGYAGSMTQGIVSATKRNLDVGGGKSYKSLIQTDASINPGNSGGPLLNAYGQVIGINTAIRGDAQGIGFAISVTSLRDLLPRFLNSEALNRAVLGFAVSEIRTLTPPATVVSRVVVTELAASSGAAKAGLAAGDQLFAIDGAPVKTIVDAAVALANAKVGETVVLQVAHAGEGAKLHEVKVPVVAAPPPESEVILSKRVGIEGKTVTPALAKTEKLAIDAGVLVTSVEKGSPAAEAGLERGDTIFQLGPYYVSSIEDVANLLKSAKPETKVVVGIVRANSRGRTTMKIR